jgi:hypothetical protein
MWALTTSLLRIVKNSVTSVVCAADKGKMRLTMILTKLRDFHTNITVIIALQ